MYDRLRQQIVGHRLIDARARRYQRIVPQFGRHPSAVLGLDLAIEGGTLRFFSGMAELPGSGDLIGRLHKMVADLEARASDAAEQATQAQQQATQAQEQATQAQEQATQAQQQAARALSALREGIEAFLGARGIVLSSDARARLSSCADETTLRGWLIRATTAGTTEEIFAD